MNRVLTLLFLTMLLTACTTSDKKYIVPCHVPEKLNYGVKWSDLVGSYIEVYRNLELCAEKVRKHNE